MQLLTVLLQRGQSECFAEAEDKTYLVGDDGSAGGSCVCRNL